MKLTCLTSVLFFISALYSQSPEHNINNPSGRLDFSLANKNDGSSRYAWQLSKEAIPPRPYSALITISARHQSLDTMSALFRFDGKVPKHLRRTAVYEIVACADYLEAGTKVSLSTARIRSMFADAGLFLNSPVLNLITVDADASTTRTLLELGTGLAPGGSFAAVVASSNEYVRAAAFGGSLILSLLGRSKQRPIAITDPGHLDVDKGCASYLTLAKWPSKGSGKEFATVTVMEWKYGNEVRNEGARE